MKKNMKEKSGENFSLYLSNYKERKEVDKFYKNITMLIKKFIYPQENNFFTQLFFS